MGYGGSGPAAAGQGQQTGTWREEKRAKTLKVMRDRFQLSEKKCPIRQGR